MAGQISRLEDLSTNTYLTYLEHEAAAYVNLTQSDSNLLRSIAPKMVTALKHQLSRHVGCNGVTSTSIRQKMLEIVLSERFPSPKYANIYVHKRTAKVIKNSVKIKVHGKNRLKLKGIFHDFFV